MKKKVISFILAISTLTTVTACDMKFVATTNSGKEYTVDLDNLQTSQGVLTELGNVIETANLNSEKGLSALSEKVDKIAEDIKIENSEISLEFQKATFVRVVDGDTIVVNIAGQDKKVRLIGINTPESVAPESYRIENTEEGILASDYTKKLLENVKEVYLQKDVSDTDKYDRLLRYVWLEIPEDKNNINEISTKMLNALLVLDNVAEPAAYEPDTMYADDFEYISEM